MADRKFLCRSEKLLDGEFIELTTEIGGQRRFLVATRHEGEARAWLNVCPHQGRPLNWAPDQFLKDREGHLVCAAHGAVFEANEGRCLSGPCKNAALTAVTLAEDGMEVHVVSGSD